jgi:outer membrane receptor protein involved in Fe transport
VLTINPTSGLPNGPATFEADTLDSYEAGFKFQSDEDRFGLDLSAYHIDWNNLIYNVTIGGFASRGNAPDGARVNGSELALYVRPVRGLRVESAVAFQDARMNEAVPTGLKAAKDERLPSVPRLTAALSSDYRADGGWQPTVGATVSYVDARTASYNASTSIPQYHLPPYTSVDLRAGLTFGSVNAQLYVRNLFDERGQLMTRFTSPLAGPMTVSILQPRTIGLNLLMQF